MGKCFIKSFNIFLTLRQYGRFYAYRSFSCFFFLVLMVFGINLILSLTPLFSETVWLNWSWLIKNDFTGKNVWDLMCYCFRYFLKYSRGMFWFSIEVYRHYLVWCVPVSKFILTSRKLTILKLVCIIMFKPHFLNSLIITFLFLSISGPDRFLTTFKQSFTENLMTIIKKHLVLYQ